MCGVPQPLNLKVRQQQTRARRGRELACSGVFTLFDREGIQEQIRDIYGRGAGLGAHGCREALFAERLETAAP
jgi:hypothetical protein